MTSSKLSLSHARRHLEYSISHIPGVLNVAPKPGVEIEPKIRLTVGTKYGPLDRGLLLY